jgi:DNA polymerase-3 subunit alpha
LDKATVTASFVHLRVHSEYSLADSIVRVEDLVQSVRTAGMPAVALTDLANLFGAVKFYRQALGQGIKPLIGADVWIANPSEPAKPWRLLLLCQDMAGYRHLCRLLARAYTEGQHAGRPCISKDWLESPLTGLIALSGAQDGDVGQALLAGNEALAGKLVTGYRASFPGGFYLELQRTGQPFQEDCVHASVALAGRLGVPVVATNPVVFLRPEDFEAHEVRVCIQDGRVLTDPRRPRHYTPQQYLRSAQEMAELFADIPEALANTVAIARRCNFKLDLGRYYLPDWDVQGRTTAASAGRAGAAPVPAGMGVDDVLRREAEAGLARRLARWSEAERDAREKAYRERLDMELGVIIKMGFPGYFLIVADFIRWARENGVPVGPGRGSGAGSLVAWCLGITELDPIRYELLFERFLNPERVSLPDFDVDFCIEGRDRVIEYVTGRYGRDKVSQIITHGTMAAKAVVRDVGRVLDHPYGYVDKIAKLIPMQLEMTLDKALEQEPLLKERYDKEEDVRALIDMGRKLEGLARSAGKHAAGVVIAPGPLTDYMPLYCEQGSTQTVTQFDMGDVEAIGLVKFDFLGLRNLTIIDRAIKLINAERATRAEPPVAIEDIPLDDAKTFELIKSARTTALFQLESRGMKDLVKRLKPDRFEDIVALVALFRPGPLQSGMVDDFINRKHGRTAIKYPYPSLEPILKPTYGVILYQEQVMQIAQVLSGYTLGGADLLRRAMGKKKPEEMAQQRDVFVKGAEQRGVKPQLAADIFDLIEKFAGYGFNRSHSAAYALIAYQTAWLKAHYPAAFMAAVLSSDMDKTDKVVTMIAELRDMQLGILSPDVNRCGYEFVPMEATKILYGLGAIKGLGRAAIDAILEARASGGPFRDLFDFCRRVDTRKINRRAIEQLVRAGAFDEIGPHRAAIWAALPAAMAAAEQHTRDHQAGQNDLFGAMAETPAPVSYPDVPAWSEEQRLEGEKETLGLYLTGHPIARYAAELAKITDSSIAELRPTEDKTTIVAGLVVALRTMQTRRGDRMAFVTLDDRTGRLELAVFSELFQKSRDLIAKDTLVVVEGHVSVDDYTDGFKMSAERIYNVEQARIAFGRRLVIDVAATQICAPCGATSGNGFIADLKEILAPSTNGKCPVLLRYRNESAEAEISLGEQWRVEPSAALLARLAVLAGDANIRVDY